MIPPGRPSHAARLARKIGQRVGAGETPIAAAAREFLIPEDLIALRLEFHDYYDTGILEGRGEIVKRKHRRR